MNEFEFSWEHEEELRSLEEELGGWSCFTGGTGGVDRPVSIGLVNIEYVISVNSWVKVFWTGDEVWYSRWRLDW